MEHCRDSIVGCWLYGTSPSVAVHVNNGSSLEDKLLDSVVSSIGLPQREQLECGVGHRTTTVVSACREGEYYHCSRIQSSPSLLDNGHDRSCLRELVRCDALVALGGGQ